MDGRNLGGHLCRRHLFGIMRHVAGLGGGRQIERDCNVVVVGGGGVDVEVGRFDVEVGGEDGSGWAVGSERGI